MDKIGDRLARYRHARGLSQAQLAQMLGIKPSSVAEWEIHESKPRLQRLPQIAQILGVPVEWLVEGEPAGEAKVRADLAAIATKLALDDLEELLRIAKRFSRAA